MITLKKGLVTVYSANNITETNVNEETSFFSVEDGNNRDCVFVGTYKQLKTLGYE